jgi:hypothetical protein
MDLEMGTKQIILKKLHFFQRTNGIIVVNVRVGLIVKYKSISCFC